MPNLSIIIPVYNVEKYVGSCLESIFSQDVPEQEYEVIVVNDGTPDNSMSVVEKYSNHSNIKIINQTNRGLSGARNRGLWESEGDYIWFIDSDDYISKDSIATILRLIRDVKAEVFSISHRNVYEKDGTLGPEIKGIKEKYMSIEEFTKTPLCLSCAPFYVFNRNFFIDNNLLFHEGIYHEDMEYIAKLKVLCENIYVCPSTLYYYLIRETGSIMTSFNIKRSYDCIIIADELLQFKKTLCDKKKTMRLNRSIAFILILSLLNVRPYYKSEENNEVTRFVSQMASVITFRNYREILNHHPLSFYLIVCMMCIFISPKLFLYLYPKKK